jgi:hypothetical protein
MMRFNGIALLPPAVVLFACTITTVVEAADLKIRTIQQNSGSPVAMNPRREEYVLYLQGNRRRTEERREQRNPLWSGGPEVTFYEPHTAVIESCEGDTKKGFSLNLDNRTVRPIEMSRRLTPEEIRNFQSQNPPEAERPTQATVLHQITTKDTGERKQSFGFTARHVITTFKVVPLAGSTNVTEEEIVTDGWYIDLDTRISCDPPRTELIEGTTYSYAAIAIGTVTTGQNNRPMSVSKPELVQTTYIGKPEAGFPIWRKTSIRMHMRNSEQRSVAEAEVKELSANRLDPNLFEVPTNFRSVSSPQAQLGLRVAWWARWLAWGHHYWLWFRKVI